MVTRWGIAGTGRICTDFVMALKALHAEHCVVAVTARALPDALEFARKHGVERAYGSYDQLAKDTDIDVVYVGVIHPMHYSVAITMVAGGKNVLCEKPLCLNYMETKLLVYRAWQKDVFLMEGLWTRHFPVYYEMMRRVRSGEVGEVVQVMSSLGLPMLDVPRAVRKELGGGATLDLGVYCVQFVSLVMGGEAPLKVIASGHLNDDSVDETTSATLVYSKGRLATISCSIRCLLPNECLIIGTKGIIKLPCRSNCPEVLESPSGRFESLVPDYGREFLYPCAQGLMYEAMEVRRCLKAGLKESPRVTLTESLVIAETLEKIRSQVGVRYPQDD